MFSLAQYIKDNQDQDFLSLPESLYDNLDDNQFQDNSNQLVHFEPLNQINNPDALNEEQKMSLKITPMKKCMKSLKKKNAKPKKKKIRFFQLIRKKR